LRNNNSSWILCGGWGQNLFKKYIWLPIFVFAFVTVQQSIFNNEIHWVDNILFSVFFYLIYVFWEWSKKPYDWNKKDKSAK